MNISSNSIKPFLPLYRSLALFFLFLFISKAQAQPPQYKVFLYIDNYAEKAIEQMVEFKIPASVILAQAIYESGSGTSALAQKSNNHFGIKCHIEWGGDTIIKHDDTLNECFRKYDRIEDSYTDHSLFLSSRARYAHLFKLSVNDYKSWCFGLKQAGYATSPDYAEKLIQLIEEAKLYELDACDFLQSKLFVKGPERELKNSGFKLQNVAIKDLAKSGYIWLDAGDVHLQSLDMIVENLDEDFHLVAEK